MQRFTFSLEPVLKLKRRREWLAEIQQRQAAAAVQAARAEMDALRDQLDAVARALQTTLGHALDMGAWLAHYRQSARLTQALEAADRKVEQAAQALEAAADRRRQIATEVEALFTLREQQWQEYRQGVARAEQEALDELGLRRWGAARDEMTEEGESPCEKSP